MRNDAQGKASVGVQKFLNFEKSDLLPLIWMNCRASRRLHQKWSVSIICRLTKFGCSTCCCIESTKMVYNYEKFISSSFQNGVFFTFHNLTGEFLDVLMLQRGCWMTHLSTPNHSQNLVVTNWLIILSSIHWINVICLSKGLILQYELRLLHKKVCLVSYFHI